jgi:drug/metabolite transporter (DMT)-like permease
MKSASGRLDRLATGALLLASLLWGAAITGTKYALDGFDPFTLLLIQIGAATAALWTLVVLRGVRTSVSKVRSKRAWKLAVVLGLLEPGIANLSETFGLSHTTAAEGALVTALEAAFVVVLAAALLGERITRTTALAVALAFIGLIVLQGGNPFGGYGLGDLYVALGVLSAATYTIVAKRFGDDEDPLALTAYQFTAATGLALLVVGGRWLDGRAALPTGVPAKYWCAAVGVGVFGFAVSFLLFNATISRVNAGAASIVLNSIPLFGIVSAVIFLGESLQLEGIIGALLIGTSVICFVVVESRKPVVVVIPDPRVELPAADPSYVG